MKSQFLAYWLIPAEPARSTLRSTIVELAERFDAPKFEPHVTIYVCAFDRADPAGVLEKICRDAQPITLTLDEINFSDAFTKSLFVQFAPNKEASDLSGALRNLSRGRSDYLFYPHVSLLYKKMPRADKIEIARAIQFPFKTVTFDSIGAVIGKTPVETREDVEAWETVATGRLRS